MALATPCYFSQDPSPHATLHLSKGLGGSRMSEHARIGQCGAYLRRVGPASPLPHLSCSGGR
eukprot:5667056-Amphidinium_carterae.2